MMNTTRKTLAVLGLLCAGCPSTGKGLLHRDAIRPSVDAITTEFDTLVQEAVGRGAMKPVVGDAWLGESALLRHVVSEDPSQPVQVPGAIDPPPAGDPAQ